MSARERLPLPFGIAIDRSRPLGYSFDGRSGSGYAGDTLASALAGDGVWFLSRSFKYHRPRGLFSLAGHDANTMVQVEDEPNVLADRLALRE
ncbi:MAG TPA: 2Fe-2S iron-sulfur cluster-binding protein, partial [Defluviicoccus sp.]|nr:2Fe-2S iron-sulfur cluster-binding protein [Defluviicoccus sp.]